MCLTHCDLFPCCQNFWGFQYKISVGINYARRRTITFVLGGNSLIFLCILWIVRSHFSLASLISVFILLWIADIFFCFYTYIFTLLLFHHVYLIPVLFFLYTAVLVLEHKAESRDGFEIFICSNEVFWIFL